MEFSSVALASDHAGVDIKAKIGQLLEKKGITVKDFGTDSTESMDYPDTIGPACQAVSRGEFNGGIMICGTGIGASITANKVNGIRAALCHNDFTTEMCRRHNNANVLVMGQRVLDEETMLRLVQLWLETPFEGGRHARRVGKIHDLEKQNTAS